MPCAYGCNSALEWDNNYKTSELASNSTCPSPIEKAEDELKALSLFSTGTIGLGFDCVAEERSQGCNGGSFGGINYVLGTPISVRVTWNLWMRSRTR